MTTESTLFDLEDDDLFARPPRGIARQQAKEAHITCRVCDRPATIGIDHPALLCPECLEDLDATRDRVAAWLASALARLDENERQWQADITANPAGEKWPTIQAALIAVAEHRATPQALASTWAKRKAEGGALARLLKNYELYAATCDQLAEELEKLHQAQREINAAFLAGEV